MNQLALELFSKEELQTTNGVNGNGHAKSKSFTLAGGKVQVITLPTKPPNIFKKRPEPQKSRSLQRLVEKGQPPYAQVDTVIIRPEERPYVPFTSTKYFVRPCPMNPNHGADVGGFYSEVVCRKDLSQYIHEMRLELAKTAPDAAIIIQPYIEARMSAVVAPGQYMVIGEGHDGVTAGHGRQYTFPFRGTSEFGYSHNGWLTKLDENPKEVELELVWGKHKNKPYIVQIRAASEHVELNPPPTPEAKPGFVPQPCAFTIDDIYVVEDLNDLGALEAVEEAPKGLLVIQPFGSLLSHASAHCRGLGIPLVIDDPENYQVGEQISGIGSWVVKGDAPTALVTGADYDPADYAESFWKGTDYAREFWDRKWDRLALFFHQFASTPTSDPEDTAFLAGAFTGFLTMASAMVCLGEARHIKGNTSSNYSAAGYKTKLNEVFTVFARLMPDKVNEEQISSMSMGRDKVYEWFEARSFTWEETASLLEFLDKDVFAHEEVGWCSAYGGDAWATSARKAFKVAEAIDARDLSAAIGSINKLENAVHNGGWLFNKFASKVYFDKATSGLTYGEDEHLAFRIAEVAEEMFEGLYAMRHADRYTDNELTGVIENARQEPIEALPIYESDNDEEPSTKKTASPGGAHGKATLTGSHAPSESEPEESEKAPEPTPLDLDPAGYTVYEGLVEDALEAGVIDEPGANRLLSESPGIIRGEGEGALIKYFHQRGSIQYLRRFAEPEDGDVKGKLHAHAYDHGWYWESGVPQDLLEDAELEGLISIYDPVEWEACGEDYENVHAYSVFKTIVKWLDDAGFISPKEGDQLLAGKYYSKSRVIEVLLRAVDGIDPEDEWDIFTYVKLHPAKQQSRVQSFGYAI